eukprot:1253371-Alexandrium_andersonii.AAC.1
MTNLLKDFVAAKQTEAAASERPDVNMGDQAEDKASMPDIDALTTKLGEVMECLKSLQSAKCRGPEGSAQADT